MFQYTRRLTRPRFPSRLLPAYSGMADHHQWVGQPRFLILSKEAASRPPAVPPVTPPPEAQPPRPVQGSASPAPGGRPPLAPELGPALPLRWRPLRAQTS